jgi:hypothetical protein
LVFLLPSLHLAVKLPCLITSFLRESLLILASDAACIVLPAFRLPALILSGLCCIFIEFALPFFLVLFLLREFLLTLLKIKIRFSHWMPPEEEIFKLSRALMRAGRTRD